MSLIAKRIKTPSCGAPQALGRSSSSSATISCGPSLSTPADILVYLSMFLASARDLLSFALLTKRHHHLLLANIKDRHNKQAQLLLRRFSITTVVVSGYSPKWHGNSGETRKARVSRSLPNGTEHGETIVVRQLTKEDSEVFSNKLFKLLNTSDIALAIVSRDHGKMYKVKSKFKIEARRVPPFITGNENQKTGFKNFGRWEGAVYQTYAKEYMLQHVSTRIPYKKEMVYHDGELLYQCIYPAAFPEICIRPSMQGEFPKTGYLRLKYDRGAHLRTREIRRTNFHETEKFQPILGWREDPLSPGALLVERSRWMEDDDGVETETNESWDATGVRLSLKSQCLIEEWWPTGIRKKIEVVLTGGRTTLESYHPNGKIKFKQNLLNGQLHGLAEGFNVEGILTDTNQYHAGELVT